MSTRTVHLRRINPSSDALREALLELGEESAIVTAFDDLLLRQARETLGEVEQLELVAWGDLLGRLAMLSGQSVAALPTRGQTLSALRIACEELPEENIFAPAAAFAGFQRKLESTLGELHQFDIDTGRLSELAAHASPPLRQKLLALSALDLRVDDLLEQCGRSRSHHRARQWLAAPQPGAPYFQRLIVLAGSEVHPLAIRVLQRLSTTGPRVTVVVEDAPEAFEAGAHTAVLLGHPPREVDLFASTHWTHRLFSAESTEEGPELAIFSAADPLAECEWVLRRAQEWEDQGVLDSRIGIVVPDTEVYVPLLRTSAERLGLRLDARVRVPLLTNGFAALILRLLGVLAEHSPAGLADLSSSSYLRGAPLEPGASEGLRSATWEDLMNPLEEGTSDWLRPMALWRAKVSARRWKVAEWSSHLHDLTTLDPIATAARDPEVPRKEHDHRAQTAMLRAVQDFAVTHDTGRAIPLSIAEFAQLCDQLWQGEETVLPSARRGFRVVTDPRELGAVDVLFAMGMLEGVLPRRRSEDPILDDDDRTEMGVGLLTSDHAARAQRDRLLRLCATPTRRLELSYPAAGEERENVPSGYLDEVRRALRRQVPVRHYARSEWTPPREECRLRADLALRDAIDAEHPAIDWPELLTEEAQEIVRPAPDEPLSIGMLSSAVECPFRAIAAYRLRLNPEGGALERGLRRLPMASKLLTQPAPDVASAALSEELERAASHGEAPWELVLMRAGGSRQIGKWVDAEFFTRNIWPRVPGSTRLNVTLDEEPLRSSLALKGRKLRLSGEVPGLSEIGPYLVIHLFQTGSPEEPKKSKEPQKWLKFGLLIAAAWGAKRPIALDVASANGGRRLLFCRRYEGDGLTGDANRGIFATEIKRDHRELLEEIKDATSLVVAALDSGRMRATPGDYCDRCDFGELCRVSSVMNDLENPFEAEEE